jgi:tetratricopeptide (TPR) repeat protein
VPLVIGKRESFTFYNDPKYAVLHLVALVIIVAWAWDLALSSRPLTLPLIGWGGARPERWAVVSAGLLALAAIISTALSPLPAVSLWGRNFADLGYELYSVLAFLTVFFAIALRLRSDSQVRRLMLMIAGIGTIAALYGLSQHFGWDPFGPGEVAGRVFSSFGNPILFGSFLVMSAVITVSVALGEYRKDRKSRYGWLVLGIAALGLQLTGLWFAGARGPWVGYAVGALAFVAISHLWLNRELLIKGLTVVGAGLVLAIVITFIPVPGDDGGGGAGRGGGVGSNARSLVDLTTIFDDSANGTVGGRGPIWESALELSIRRDWSPAEPAMRTAVRPFVGYGPDMFYYAYPLGLEVDILGTVPQHAHNFYLQILMELGLLGLAMFAAMSLLAIYAGWLVLVFAKRAGEHEQWISITLVGVMAALVGRSVEQLPGVARLGDLLPFWMLMGLLIAIVQISRRDDRNEPVAVNTASRGARRRGVQSQAGRRYLAIGVAGTITLVALGILYFRDVQMLQASAISQDGMVLLAQGRNEEALAKFERAADLSPYVESYHLEVYDLYAAAAGSAESIGNSEAAVFNWERAHSAAERYGNINPRALDTQERLAQAESRLAALGDDGKADIATDGYIAIAASLPSFASAQTAAARGLLSVGENRLGLLHTDRAIALEAPGATNAEAWWLRGVAQERLGESGAAEESYKTVIERSPGSGRVPDAHRGLARIYRASGDAAAAEREQGLAEGGNR